MNSINYQTFGQFIMQLRKENGLTQKQLAEKIFLSDKAISKWERGLGLPDISLLIPLSEILQVSTTELLYSRRIESNAQFSIDEVNDLMSKTITLKKEKHEHEIKAKQKRIKIFICALCFFMVELIVFILTGGSITTIPQTVVTVELLMLIFGTYFTFFVKERLPVYYDENKIGMYSHGPLRMNIPGIVFNNSNWHHIVRVTQCSIMCIFTLFPLVYIVLTSFFPIFWQKGQLILTLASAFSFIIPLYIVEKKYE